MIGARSAVEPVDAVGWVDDVGPVDDAGPVDDVWGVERLVRQLDRTDLRPGPVVDALFSALVALSAVVPVDHPAIRDPVSLARVHEICALGESYLEEHWAQEILADPARLDGFPYLTNYRSLAAAEHRALMAASDGPLRHVVFAGCGPLPLTALELHRIAPDLRITCLDVDAAAVARARAVIDALAGPGHRVAVVHGDAADHDYADADAVLVAALVGPTPGDKRRLLARIAVTCGRRALLAARSVPDDGRRLLYARLEPADVGRTLHVVDEWLPPPGVINSLVLMRVSS